MTAVIIILAALLTIGLLPLGVSLSYDADGLKLSAVLGLFKKGMLPAEKKPEKPKKPKKHSSFSLPEFLTEDRWALIKLILELLARFRRRIYLEHFTLHYISAGDDPYEGVMRYNRVNAVLGSIAPLFEQVIRVKRRDISLDIDFQSEKSIFELSFSLNIRIMRIIGLLILTLLSVLKLRHRRRIENKTERKSSDGEQVK